jgi:hypothetical protein
MLAGTGTVVVIDHGRRRLGGCSSAWARRYWAPLPTTDRDRAVWCTARRSRLSAVFVLRHGGLDGGGSRPATRRPVAARRRIILRSSRNEHRSQQSAWAPRPGTGCHGRTLAASPLVQLATSLSAVSTSASNRSAPLAAPWARCATGPCRSCTARHQPRRASGSRFSAARPLQSRCNVRPSSRCSSRPLPRGTRRSVGPPAGQGFGARFGDSTRSPRRAGAALPSPGSTSVVLAGYSQLLPFGRSRFTQGTFHGPRRGWWISSR